MYKSSRRTLIGLSIILLLTINVGFSIIASPKSPTNFSNKSIAIQPSFGYEYEWLVTYGKDGVDQGFGIAMDSLDNIYVTGFQDGCGPFCLLKYNCNGSLLWNKTLGIGSGYDIVVNDTNSIYITGHISGQICLLKYNSSGDLLLSKTWGYLDFGIGYGIDLDNLGNIYITGYYANYKGENRVMILFKYNTSGHLEWNKTLGFTNSEGRDIILDEIGNIYITGGRQNGLNKLDVCILKYNSSGNLEWERTWGGPEDDIGNGIILDDLGNIYITGDKEISLNDYDLCILKYDSLGNLEWEEIWGGSENEFGTDIKMDHLGNIYVTGSSGSFKQNSNLIDILLAKFDKYGHNLGFKTWGAWSGTDYGFGLTIDDLGYAYITGTKISTNIDNFVDIFLLKYNLDKIPIIYEPAIPSFNILIFIFSIGIIIFLIKSLELNKRKEKYIERIESSEMHNLRLCK